MKFPKSETSPILIVATSCCSRSRSSDQMFDGAYTRDDEIDEAVGQARLLEEPHDVVRREHRRARGLPDDGVSHQRGRARQVRRDRREVERRDREDEAFERTVLEAVPDFLRGDRLLL